MFLSLIHVDLGNDPDRPRPGRLWFRNMYRVHQRLSMAFPSDSRKSDDAYFLKPFKPEDFAKQLHVPRTRDGGFLFRIDPQPGNRAVILVQSAARPDWDYAFGLTEDVIDDRGHPIGNAGFLLSAPPQAKPVSIALDGDALLLKSEQQDYTIRSGDLVRFRLRANPTRKIQDGSRNGKRMRVEPKLEPHWRWLREKFGGAADCPICINNFVPGWAYGWRSKHEPQPGEPQPGEPQPSRPMQWWSVLFEGSFRVGDTGVLKILLESGIGPAKAFGFGLLSIAPVRV